MVRKPIASGNFYPGTKAILEEELGKYIEFSDTKKKVIGIVSPHAGYVFSGACAGKVFGAVDVPGIVIILGVNHYGFGHPFAVDGHDSWQTPLGAAEVHKGLREKLTKDSEIFGIDNNSSIKEHSLEVQLPFIQFFKKDFSIVPICISYDTPFNNLEELGKAISQGIKELKEEVLIVASTDMSHYVSQEVAQKKDFLAIERVLQLDARGLYDTVQREQISMCGFQPTTSAIVASKELGAQNATLIKYQTSGDTTGNYFEVVGYAGIRIN